MTETTVALEARVPISFEDAVARCREALAAEGFGVLTEIDIQQTLKNKLGVDRDPFVILGACHPPSAHRALEAAPQVGVLLPCNVTVSTEEGETVVRAMNPSGVMDMLADPVVEEVGREVGAALERVLATVATATRETT